MGKLRFSAAFPISVESEETELSIKLSGIRFSGQSEKWMPEDKTERKNWTRTVVDKLDGTKSGF